jgi:hypothetical protein
MTTASLSFSKSQKNLHPVKYRKTVISAKQKLFNGVNAKINSISLLTINWKTVCFTGFFISLALLVFYVCQINDLTRGSYLINSYDKQINKLSEENKNLEVSFAENSFLGQALVKIQALNFQKTTSVKYINILDGSAKAMATNKNI